MLNRKLILLCGYARGGTNIAWNILQSHPNICSPIFETGEIFRKSLRLRFFQKFGRFFDFKNTLDRELFSFKMRNLTHEDNKYKNPEETYTKIELENTALCLKSVNKYIYYSELIYKNHPNLYYIAITRNGYSLIDGYLRRGKKLSEVSELYNAIYHENRRLSGIVKNFKIFKFEEILKDPFGISKQLYEFVQEEPFELDHLRFKAKKIITSEGKHKVNFGDEDKKYWVDKSSIYHILDKDINKKQFERLDKNVIEEFNTLAGEAMKFYGYDLL